MEIEEREPVLTTQVDRKKFVEAVTSVSRFVANKTNIPILARIELRFEKTGGIRVRGTDLESACTATIPTEEISMSDDHLSVYVDREKFTSSVKTITGEAVDIAIVPGFEIPNQCPECGSLVYNELADGIQADPNVPWTQKQCLQCGKISSTEDFKGVYEPQTVHVGNYFRIATECDESEYPPVPDAENVHNVCSVSVKKLTQMVVASGKDEPVFHLDGVMFDNTEKLMIATNGHRLYTIKQKSFHKFFLPADVIRKMCAGRKGTDTFDIGFRKETVSDKTLEDLKKPELAEKYEEIFGKKPASAMTKVDIIQALSERYLDKTAFITGNGMEICARMPDINFPDYKVVANGKLDDICNHITIEAGPLLEAVRQSQSLSKEMPVKMSFNGCIDVEACTTIGDSYRRKSVPVKSGEVEPPVTIGFNGRYILDILAMFDKDDEIAITLQEPTKPMFMEHGDFCGLIMPTRIE